MAVSCKYLAAGLTKRNAQCDQLEKDKAASPTLATDTPLLPCEFCDGLVPMRKLLEHQVKLNSFKCTVSGSIDVRGLN